MRRDGLMIKPFRCRYRLRPAPLLPRQSLRAAAQRLFSVSRFSVSIALRQTLRVFISCSPRRLRFSLIAHVALGKLNAALLQHFSESRHGLIQQVSAQLPFPRRIPRGRDHLRY